MIIRDEIINTKNITHVWIHKKEANGYVWKHNTTINIYLIGEKDPLIFVFYDDENEEELERVLKELEEALK